MDDGGCLSLVLVKNNVCTYIYIYTRINAKNIYIIIYRSLYHTLVFPYISKHIAIYHIFAYIAFWLQPDIFFLSCLGFHLSTSCRPMVV